jgi:hypothetical protein
MTLKLSFGSFVFGTPIPVTLVKLKHWVIPASVTNFIVCNSGAVEGKFMVRFGKIRNHNNMLT